MVRWSQCVQRLFCVHLSQSSCLHLVLFLQVTQSCWALVHFKCKPEPKCRVERLSEPAEKGVEVKPSVRGDIKEGQKASPKTLRLFENQQGAEEVVFLSFCNCATLSNDYLCRAGSRICHFLHARIHLDLCQVQLCKLHLWKQFPSTLKPVRPCVHSTCSHL